MRGFCLVLLGTISLTMFAQNVTVTGTVSDNRGEPLIGVTVQIQGTSTGTVTDMDGNFSLPNVPLDATVEISYVGMRTQTIPLNGRSLLRVVLEEDTELLEELVVVGYGQMRRSDLTGSVVSVSEDAIKKSIPTSIDQVLQGRAAGVQIQANSGTPGASSAIRIRGINSLNATSQPIFVIDGVIVDSSTDSESSNPLSSINPSDIVSMDVLKDASATAIYGARASNGVIMITTRRGQSGEALISYDGYIGTQSMPKHLEMMNLQEYARHHNDRSDFSIVEKSSAFVRPDMLGPGTDWQEELYQKALMTSHNLSITGGNEKTTYAISAGFLDQEGIALGSGFRRLSLRGSMDNQVKSWLKAGINFSLSDSKQEVGADNDIIMNALRQQPMVAVYGPDGTFDGPEDVWMPVNPVGMASIRENYNKRHNFRFNTYLDATLADGLTFKTELSTDYNQGSFYYFEPSYRFGVLTNNTRTSRRTKNDTKYWSWRNFLTYNKVLADQHNVNAMLGQEMSESQWENLVGSATGFLSNTTHDLSAGDASKSSGTGSSGASSISSFFGRIFYSFDDRYLLTATLRRDGSSKFAPGNRWGWFPSLAAAWRVTGENFLKDHEVIDTMKFRFGWGGTGNQNVENWAYMALLSPRTTPWGTGVLTGNTANPDLRWETTYSTNLGLDLNLWQNRVEFIADVYYKKTTDLLLQLPLPAYLGSSGQGAASNPWANVGELENKGIEMTLNTVNIDNSGFQWRSNFVFSLNRNKVLSLDTDNSSIEKVYRVGSETNIVTRTTVDQPIGQFWGYRVIGRFEKAEDFYYKDANGNVQQVALPEGVSIGENGSYIGDYIFEDLNKDGKIDNNDATFIGNPEPKFSFGIGNSFSWKGFDLNIFLAGSYGNDVLNYNRRFIEDPRANNNLLKTVLDYAKVDRIDPNGPDDFRNLHLVGGDRRIPRLSASTSNGNNRVSDLYIEDGSFLRIQNISFGYTLPKRWVSKLALDNVRLYTNLQNVYTWTKYRGYDPEIGYMYGDALMSGLDYGRYPSPRIYTFGINLSF
ncbi:MAG: TonB-dependent receptor [Spirochaetia bacterium]|nr:TonB-dependent receptor [Spirochaetia bacterium]